MYMTCTIIAHESVHDRTVKMARRAGGPEPPTHLKNHKSIGFLSNTGPDPLKNHKATEPAFNVNIMFDDGP